MLRFYAERFHKVASALSGLIELTESGEVVTNRPSDSLVIHTEASDALMMERMKVLSADTSEMGMPLSSLKALEISSSVTDSNRTYREELQEFRMLDWLIEKELSAQVIMRIEEPEMFLSEIPLGRKVKERFPDEHADIMESAKCLALDRPTAAVFHLTRAIEQLARRFGKKFGVRVKDGKGRHVPIKEAFWKDILNAVEAKLKAEHQPTKRLTAKRKVVLSEYEDLALRLEHIKNAWRNPVSHGVFYEPSEAKNIYELTRIFTQKLVTIL